jgi:hypothetical protein
LEGQAAQLRNGQPADARPSLVSGLLEGFPSLNQTSKRANMDYGQTHNYHWRYHGNLMGTRLFSFGQPIRELVLACLSLSPSRQPAEQRHLAKVKYRMTEPRQSSRRRWYNFLLILRANFTTTLVPHTIEVDPRLVLLRAHHSKRTAAGFRPGALV